MKKVAVKLSVGEKEFTIDPKDVVPETTLNQFLREVAHLTATKRSCLEGGCGVCVVTAELTDPATRIKKIIAVNSCLVSIYSCHDWKIHTNEGIGNYFTGYNPLQNKLAEGNGSQCGFCSSGMIMNMYSLINSGKPTPQQVENSFSGNLCRCTGYRPILKTFRSFVEDIEDYKPCTKKCEDCFEASPGSINILCEIDGKEKWMKFYYLKDLLSVLSTITETYMLVAGNTAKGVYKDPLPHTYLDVSSVNELIVYKTTDDNLILGANISLNRTIEIFKETAKNHSQLSYLELMSEHIDLIANVPVRNIATIAGNLMLKHKHPEFQSDMFLILETVNAILVIVDTSENETRVTPAQFLKLNMNKKVIKNVILKGYNEKYIYKSYKIMSRAQNTPATVNAGFLFHMVGDYTDSCRIVFGNINPNFVHAENAENYLKHKQLHDNNTLKDVLKLLKSEINPDVRLPEASPKYRQMLAISLFYKFVLYTASPNKVSDRKKLGGQLIERPLSSGKVEYTPIKSRFPLSEPIIKIEAMNQTRGQAEYIEDMPDLPGQLFAAFVLVGAAPKSIITKIDPSKALSVPGVVAFLGKEDIPGNNAWTPSEASIFTVKEVLFSEGVVEYHDQPVGIIVANNQELAEAAADLVIVETKPGTEKYYLDIREVLAASESVQKERVKPSMNMDPRRKGTDIQKVIKGEVYQGLQYHFHMELQCCNVVPLEDGLDVFPSSQWIDANQIAIAALLNLKNTQVNVKVRRLGGAFGGKIVRSVFVSNGAALAAYKLKRPVKMRLPLVKNMKLIGKRYPLLVQYEAGVDKKGIIQYMDAKLYSDYGVGGNEPMEKMLFEGFLNGYIVDTWKVSSFMVKTDTHANTFARAPGTLTGIGAIETLMDHIASILNLDPYEVKLANLNKNIHQMIFDLNPDFIKWADVVQRKQSIQEFNTKNRWRKKGMSMIPMCWTMEVPISYIALVSVFHGDGSVAIAHGGIEMGQGINTKIVQATAYKLGIPMDLIQVKPTATLTNPGSGTSGGSLTTEGCCYAVLQACDKILATMKPIKDTLKNPTWHDIVKKCYDKNIFLMASADFTPEKPNIQQYFVYGLCATDVEVDILTGVHQVNRVDILQDAGDSMNPLLDMGQVEGAFIMGLGYHTTEEIIMNDEGEILTNRTWNYKPPGAKDIPVIFNIKFPPNVPNPVGVLNVKAITEAPCCLSCSVPLAIRNAVASARKEADLTQPQWYPVDGCSTIENTFMNSLNDTNQYTLF